MASLEGIECREYRHEDAEGSLQLHDSRWRAIPPDFWHRWSHRPDVTASVALMDGRVVGQIPFHIREFLVRPGVTVRAAQEHSVIVAEEMRSRGVGSALMIEAERFLAGRCEVMMVYRGGERTPGYRFYQRTGHHDLAYHRLWTQGGETPAASRVEDPERSQRAVECTDVGTMLDRESEVLDIFQSAYLPYGGAGAPPRRKGYWKEALGSVIFCEAPGDFRWLYLEDAGRLLAYALCLEGRGERGGASVLELATRDGQAEPAVVLLRHAAHRAEEKGLTLTIRKPDRSVYAAALRQAGYVPAPRAERSMMTMARIFDPAALAQRVLAQTGLSLPVEVAVWTPERQAVLNPGDGSGRRLTLEMKECDLARLLLCRMDLLRAVTEERVTVVGTGPGDLEAVAEVFAFSSWDYHALDYI